MMSLPTDKQKKKSLLHYLVFPIVVALTVGIVGFFGKLWWDEFNKPIIEIETISITDFDLDPDFYGSLKNNPVKIVLKNAGRRTAEEVDVHLTFSHNILDITKIRTTIAHDLLGIKTATQELPIIPADNGYFTLRIIDRPTLKKEIFFAFKKLRPGESLRSVVLTEKPANLEECQLLLSNIEGGNCMPKGKKKKLLGLTTTDVIIEMLALYLMVGLMGAWAFYSLMRRIEMEKVMGKKVERIRDDLEQLRNSQEFS